MWWFFVGYGTFAFAVISLVHFLLTGQHPAITKLLSFLPSATWQALGLFVIGLVMVLIIYGQYSVAINKASDTQQGVAFGHEEAFGIGVTGLILVWIQIWAHEWEPLWYPSRPYWGMNEPFFFWTKWVAFLILAAIASYFGGYWAILVFPTRIPGAQKRSITAFRLILAIATVVGLAITSYLLYQAWFPIFLGRVSGLPVTYRERAWLPTVQFLYWLGLIAILSATQWMAFKAATKTQQGHAGALEHVVGLLGSIALFHGMPYWIYSIQNDGSFWVMFGTYIATWISSIIAFSLSYKLIGNVFLPQIKT